MVANAGVVAYAPFLESKISLLGLFIWNSSLTSLTKATTELLDQQYRVNLRGTFLCYKYAALQMIKQGRGGRIIGEK